MARFFVFVVVVVFLKITVQVTKYQITPKTLNLLIHSEIFQMVSFVRLFSEQFSMKSLSKQLECLLKGFQTFVVLSPLLHSTAA